MAHLRYWPDSMFLAQYRTRHLPCRRSVGCHARTARGPSLRTNASCASLDELRGRRPADKTSCTLQTLALTSAGRSKERVDIIAARERGEDEPTSAAFKPLPNV